MDKLNLLAPILYEDCDELTSRFYKLKTGRDVAELLKVPYEYLIYYIYRLPEDSRYKNFHAPKRTGGYRDIYSPNQSLSIIQRKLSQVLYAVYQPKPSAHGFVVGRSIVTNAKPHAGKKFILSIDIKDFFGSINFGRVRGLFIAEPYKLGQEAATVLAQICCFKNQLPQGAPTSPIISNLICSRLDTELQRFARDNRLFYTRYADDITFSSSRNELPPALSSFLKDDEGRTKVILGNQLKLLFQRNGFELNHKKTRLAFRNQRQEVTGLVVNKTVNVNRKYIRNLQGALHAWEKYGLEKAAETYHASHAQQPVLKGKSAPNFVGAIRGRIEFIGSVRGKEDGLYQRLLKQFNHLIFITKNILEKSDISQIEQRVLQACLEHFEALPNVQVVVESGKVDKFVQAGPERLKVTANGLLTLQKFPHFVQYVYEIKDSVARTAIGIIINRLERLRDVFDLPPLLVVRYLDDTVIDQLIKRNLEFVDTAGNLYLNSPTTYVLVRGKEPIKEEAQPKFIFTATNLELIYVLLRSPHLLKRPDHEIAEVTQVTVNTVKRVLETLCRLGYLLQQRNRSYHIAEYTKLLNRWELGYAESLRSELLIGTYAPISGKQFSEIEDELINRAKDEGYLIGGELGGAIATKYLRPIGATLHVPEESYRRIFVALKLKPSPEGTITLLRQFGSHNGWDNSPVPMLVDPLLIHAEMLTLEADERVRETADLFFNQYLAPRIENANYAR